MSTEDPIRFTQPTAGLGLPGRVLVVVALVAGAGPSHAAAQEPVHGPLRIEEGNPIYRLFYTPRVEPADLLEEGEIRADLGLSYSNIFEYSPGEQHFVLQDMERLAASVTVRWAPTDGLEVGASAGTTSSWAGFLDSFISGFHEFFGFPNGGRERVEEDQYNSLLLSEAPAVLFRVPARSLVMDDVRFFVKAQLAGGPGEAYAVGVRGVSTTAVAPPEARRGRSEWAAEILGRRSLGPWHLHAGLGLTTLTPPPELDPVIRDRALYVSAGVERLLTDGVSFLAQVMGGTGYVENVGTEIIDGNPMNLAFGFAGAVEGGWRWQFSFAEDVPPNSPSTDFTVDVHLSRIF